MDRGNEGCGLSWDTSCPDWADRIVTGKSLVPDLPLFAEERRLGLNAFRRLRLPDIFGTPRLGDVGGKWCEDIVEAIFGSYDAKLRRRMIQEFFLLVPKKNGKSTIAAAIMVAAIMRSTRPDGEFMFLAPSIEVAGNSYRQAKGMIRLDPALNDLFHVQDNIRRMTRTDNGAFLQIKAADVDIVTGGKPMGTLVDETHLFSTKMRAADIFVEIRGALAAREDGFLIQISTQSKAPPAGQFKAELDLARDVRDGNLRLPLLPVLYELPSQLARFGGWKDRKYWPLINPNLGRSVNPEFLASSLTKAERNGQAELALFASQHFNVEIGLALRSDRWPGAEFWDKQTDPQLTLDRLLERSEAVVVGIDGGGLDDLFGLCVLGRDKDSKCWLAWSHGWCHSGVLQRRQTIAATLQDFAQRGELTIVEDELDDISQIIEIIADIKERGLLRGVACDPAGLGEFIDALAAIQVTPENKLVVGVQQGYGLMNAMKTCERKLANGTLWHSDSHLAAWCVSNVKIEPLATSIRATKANAGDMKIDAAIALFDAATMLWQVKPAPEYQLVFV